MVVLGIETSCDETSAALVTDDRRILANLVYSQTEHEAFGGVVPEVAARAHLEALDGLIKQALNKAGLDIGAVDAVAAAGGPGLIGGVIVGVMTAKAMAAARNIPFLAVNHLEGHALAVRLTEDVSFPYLLLLTSGGHCQILAVSGPGRYVRFGATVDDAAGEAFDKSAKLMGLGYPGGPMLERAAQDGNPHRFDLPRPMKGRAGCDFSFSGLKTAVRLEMKKLKSEGGPSAQDISDLAASFQQVVADVMEDRVAHALGRFREEFPQGQTLVVSGGVAANALLRQTLAELAAREGLQFAAPPMALCTDNAAMIAWAGVERLKAGLTDSLDFRPRPRWPLDETAPVLRGAGVKA